MLPDSEYRKLIEAVDKGIISVGIERSFARKLFTEVSLSKIEDSINESLRLQKIISLTVFVGASVLILIAFILVTIAFGWWGVLGYPVLFIGWMYYKSLSVRGGAGLGFISFIAVAAIATFLLNPPSIWDTQFVFLLPFILGLWLERFLYCYTTSQLRALVLRNKKALDLFKDGIDLKEVTES